MNPRQTFITLVLLVVTMFGATSRAVAQEQVNVKMLFGMLPADAFLLLPSDNPGELEKYIKVCDYRNGYLRLEFENQGAGKCVIGT